jgi:hypothetical protein
LDRSPPDAKRPNWGGKTPHFDAPHAVDPNPG